MGNVIRRKRRRNRSDDNHEAENQIRRSISLCAKKPVHQRFFAGVGVFPSTVGIGSLLTGMNQNNPNLHFQKIKLKRFQNNETGFNHRNRMN